LPETLTAWLSERARALAPSPTLAIDSRAKELQSEGADLVNLSAGEPDFDTPAHACDAAIQAMRSGFTHYTAPEGIRELRSAICEKLARDNRLEYEPEQIVVTAGAKQALYNAMQVLCNPGDEVLVPSPYWVSYTEQAKLAGAVPVLVPTREEDGFRLTADALAERLTPRSKLLVLNSPCNPTGAVLARADLEAIGEVVLRHGLLVLADEIYEKMVYDGAAHESLAALDPEIKRRTLVINGLSKAYAMTGWRLGYAAGERPVIRAMGALQGQTTGNVTSVAQRAATAALRGPQEPIAAMVAAFAERRALVLEQLGRMPLLRCTAPAGAFYVFPRISEAFGRRTPAGVVISDSDRFCERLLEEAGLAIVPGSAFGSTDHVRLSYAASPEVLRRGLARLGRFLSSLEG
jgi:aspartate aminotransferase